MRSARRRSCRAGTLNDKGPRGNCHRKGRGDDVFVVDNKLLLGCASGSGGGACQELARPMTTRWSQRGTLRKSSPVDHLQAIKEQDKQTGLISKYLSPGLQTLSGLCRGHGAWMLESVVQGDPGANPPLFPGILIRTPANTTLRSFLQPTI